MTKAIRIHETGGPEQMVFDIVETPEPGPGEAVVRHRAIGLNYIDVYFRTGLYPAPSLPYTLGSEASGVVEAVGPDVSDVAVGDRVAYVLGGGAYAERRVIEAKHLVKLPDGIDDETAAGMMLKGLTAEYLLHRTFALQPGQSVVIHAAAGGTGQILCQWARRIGATVIGSVGSAAKVETAMAAGCHHVINLESEDPAKRVRELTGGVGAEVVYDGVGRATFMGSLDSLKKFGLLVSFGNASGPVDAFNIGLLSAKGSLYVTRPTLFAHIADVATLRAMAANLFAVVASGSVRIPVNHRFPLEQAAEAHRALEGRQTTGSTVLIP